MNKSMDWGKFDIVTFYLDNIPKDVVLYQRKVFERLGIPIAQVKVEPKGPVQESVIVASAIEQYLVSSTKEYVMLFDIDCIPLNMEIIETYIERMEAGFLVGPTQRSNHIENDKHIFCAPSALGFKRSLYDNLLVTSGKVSLFQPNHRSDIAEEFTYAMEEADGKSAWMLRPTKVEKPIWPLSNDKKLEYGEGTTFDGMIYHAFNSRHGGSARFIDKCREVLGYGHSPLFTVVVPVGRVEGIEKIRECLIQQDFIEEYQVLLICDGPKNKVTQHHFPPLKEKFTIDIIELPYNTYTTVLSSTGGIPRSIGSALAKGKYICYLDDDNEFKSNHLSSIAAVIEEKKNPEVVFTLRDFHDSKGKFLTEDNFESLGPYKGISGTGLIDTNCLCVERATMWNAMGGWLSPLREEDRWMFHNLKALGARFEGTGLSTVKYKLPDYLVSNQDFWDAQERYLKGVK